MAANVNVALRRLITVWQVGPLVGVLVFTALVQPRASHILFGLLALVFGANLASGGRVHAMFRPQGLLLASAAFAAYAFLNALWAPKPLAALGSAGLLLLYGLLAQVAANGIEREEAGAIERASHALIYAALGGAAFIAVEGLANQAIMRKLLTLLPMLRPADGGHVDVEGGVVTSIAAFMLNCPANGP